jgi:hypothetical protein
MEMTDKERILLSLVQKLSLSAAKYQEPTPPGVPGAKRERT